MQGQNQVNGASPIINSGTAISGTGLSGASPMGMPTSTGVPAPASQVASSPTLPPVAPMPTTTSTPTIPTTSTTPAPSSSIAAPAASSPTAAPRADLTSDRDPKQITRRHTSATLIADIVRKISEAHDVVIALSSDPSVDELCAAIGLSICLDRMGKRATAIFSGEAPSAISFLNPEQNFEDTADALQDFVISLDKIKADHLRYKLEGDFVKVFITPYRSRITEEDLSYAYGDYNVDLVLALNVSNGIDLDSALREYGKIFGDATTINFTSGNPGKFAEIEWSDKTMSSVSEMAARLMIGPDGDPAGTQVGSEDATAFLTGIIAATDWFSNTKTTPTSMRVGSKLLELGANQIQIAENIGTGDVNNASGNDDSDIVSAVKAPKTRVTHVETKKSTDPTALEIEHDGGDDKKPAPKLALSGKGKIGGSDKKLGIDKKEDSAKDDAGKDKKDDKNDKNDKVGAIDDNSNSDGSDNGDAKKESGGIKLTPKVNLKPLSSSKPDLKPSGSISGEGAADAAKMPSLEPLAPLKSDEKSDGSSAMLDDLQSVADSLSNISTPAPSASVDSFMSDLPTTGNKYGQMLEAALAESAAPKAPAPTPTVSPEMSAPGLGTDTFNIPTNPAADFTPTTSAPDTTGMPDMTFVPAPELANLPPAPVPPVSGPTPPVIPPSAPASTSAGAPSPFGPAPAPVADFGTLPA